MNMVLLRNNRNRPMRNTLFSIFLALMTASSPALAGESPVVVELFTSQGCSSCPPADALLAKLAQRDDVIALALHVDYWDYLGWKDSFGSPAFTSRQRGYAKAAHKRTVYTPQVVVQGERHAVGNQVKDVVQLIADYRDQAQPVALDISRVGDMLEISVKATGASVGRSVVQLVRYMPEQTVTIKAGENAGRRIVYSNIVTRWTRLTDWNGRGAIRIKTKVRGSEPIVVLVQSDDYGPIIAAHRLR